jgi:hypothetical protein
MDGWVWMDGWMDGSIDGLVGGSFLPTASNMRNIITSLKAAILINVLEKFRFLVNVFYLTFPARWSVKDLFLIIKNRLVL